MRLSCNGCRILRKGCSDDCTIRPCLEWINSPESQANATLFLAKFYGRVGLLNLINAAPPHFRPAVFKSLMYEACGRIANPAYGSLGLFWTGEWARCQAAVDAVLIGSEINVMEPSVWQLTGTRGSEHVLQARGIRHVSRDTDMDQLKGRARFKRTGNVIRPKARVGSVDSSALWKPVSNDEPGNKGGGCVSSGSDETVEASLMNQNRMGEGDAEVELDLELTLGGGGFCRFPH
ncbi:LOB domain-containing protein 41-like [Gastrolobium bilobum]|uniref:LOB domain-containing protein 41-like n=1 Tax=Gastrolobium bilobum TaxID=150636 RepID=UPI002AB10937|nr:LOB domain-containing protein 41-like [Gastrolobium bilobum]